MNTINVYYITKTNNIWLFKNKHNQPDFKKNALKQDMVSIQPVKLNLMI